MAQTKCVSPSFGPVTLGSMVIVVVVGRVIVVVDMLLIVVMVVWLPLS